MYSQVLIIGIGNEYRNDDGIGLLIAKEIKERQIPFVIVKENYGDFTEMIELWRNFKNVILIDAVSSGAKPGTLYEFDLKEARQLFDERLNRFVHGFSFNKAIKLAEILNALPEKLMVFGVEGENFNYGQNISFNIKKSQSELVDRIVNLIEEFKKETEDLILN